MKDGFIVIHKWIYDLDGGSLSITDIIIASVIYGFSVQEKGVFNGSAKYLADWAGLKSERHVYSSLKKLQEKGIIRKHSKKTNGATLNDYSFNFDVIPPCRNDIPPLSQRHTPPVVKSYHNIEDRYSTIDQYNPIDHLRTHLKKENIIKERKTGSKTPFKAPTPEEVEAYGKSKNFEFTDYLDFWEYYENKDWRIGGQKMKSWQLALHRWERMNKQKGLTNKERKLNAYDNASDNTSKRSILSKGCNDPVDYEDFGVETF